MGKKKWSFGSWLIDDVIGIDLPGAPPVNNDASGSAISKSSNVAHRPVVYGRAKITSTIIHKYVFGTASDGLGVVYDLCEGEIQSIDQILIDSVLDTDRKFGAGYVNNPGQNGIKEL